MGGAVNQTRTIILWLVKTISSIWQWATFEAPMNAVQAMDNLLIPHGLLPKQSYNIKYPKHLPIPDACQEPMPAWLRVLIKTKGGIRQLLDQEYAMGLGIPKDKATKYNNRILQQFTGLHIWEYLSKFFELLNTTKIYSNAPSSISSITSSITTSHEKLISTTSDTFAWKPPDLSVGSRFFQDCIKSLSKAVQLFPNPKKIYKEGLDILNVHRQNYNIHGPDLQKVQLIWWEFPKEHWTALSEGLPMNFLVQPPTGILDNAEMNDEQTQIAAEFVNELLALGIFGDHKLGEPILRNAPMFVVPKVGQPGQWWVIADILSRGQNQCIGLEPTILPRLNMIMDQLYTGGWSAVSDASKFFWNFLTHPKDQSYLGVLHPITMTLHRYLGLPMGSSNSPPLTGRYGLAFVRKVHKTSNIFQGNPQANCWWTSMMGTGYDPNKGYGLIFLRKNNQGLPALIWVFVDNFLIHAPTKRLCLEALNHFLNTALKCSLLCHLKKLNPPSQVVKYCGFILDMTSILCLKIPTAKREKALAMVEHLLEAPPTQTFSQLSLAVVRGTLQSLVQATPR